MVMGADPVTNAGAYVGGNYVSNNVFGGGRDLSGAERRQNELNDITRYLLQGNGGQLTDEERSILSNDVSGRIDTMTPEERLARMRVYSNSQNQGFRQQYDSLSRDSDRTLQYGYDTFRQTFGRDPSATEWSQLVPYLGGAEGRTRGAAYISELFDQYKQSPEYLGSQAGKYSDKLGSLYQELLGRGAKADELDYYGRALAGGATDFDIRKALENSQEYQTVQDKNFRTGLAGELEGYDTKFFNKQKEGVIADYARRGFAPGASPSLDYALTNLMGEISDKRNQYLSNLSAQQYGGNKEAARADYTYGRDRYFGEQDYEKRKRDAELDYYRGRSDMDRDYERQKEDYYQMIGRQNQGRNTLHGGDWINIGLGAANAGANIYGAYNRPSPYSYLG